MNSNVSALLSMYRGKGVQAVKTPAGIVFMGVRNITKEQLKTLQDIPKAQLEWAMRMQT